MYLLPYKHFSGGITFQWWLGMACTKMHSYYLPSVSCEIPKVFASVNHTKLRIPMFTTELMEKTHVRKVRALLYERRKFVN